MRALLTSRRVAGAVAVLLVTLAAVAWFAVGKEPAVESAAAAGDPLSAQQLESLGVAFGTVAAATDIAVAGLPAEIAAPIDRSAHVVTPFAGVVTRLLVDEGQDVRAGQPLVRIQSREWLAAYSDAARARSEAVLAGQQAQRDELLLQAGVIPVSRHEASRARAEIAEAQRAQADGSLAGLRAASGGAAGEFDVLAPIAGRVLRRAIAPGQTLAALDEAFSIAAPGSLDLIVHAPIGLRTQLAPGLHLRLADEQSAVVIAIGAATDRATQSLRLRARLDGEPRLLPGQHLQATLLLPAPAGSVQVPATALLPRGPVQRVFVREGGAFRAVDVETLGGDDGSVVVRGDLAPGATIAIRGASALQALAQSEG